MAEQKLPKLFNGVADGNFLVRPGGQFENFRARYQHLVYDLSPKAKDTLRLQGKLSAYINRGDHFVHQLMGSCVAASIELACGEKGLRYIPRHEILSRKNKHMKLPLSGSKYLVPDEIFGLAYPDGSFRFFACEWDRGTEPLKRTSTDQTDFGKKLDAYIEVMRNQTYRDEWGIPTMMVIVATVSEVRAKSMMEAVKEKDERFSKRFLFKVFPTFATPWAMPPIFKDILEPWLRPDGLFDITS